MLYQSLNVIYMLILRNPDVGSVWVQKVIGQDHSTRQCMGMCQRSENSSVHCDVKKCYLEDISLRYSVV